MALIIIMRKSALTLFLLSSFHHCLSLAAPVYNGLLENRSLSHRYHEPTKSEPQWKSEPMTEGYGRLVDQWNKQLDIDEKPPYSTTAPSPVSGIIIPLCASNKLYHGTCIVSMAI